MNAENITNPGQDAAEGDLILITSPSGTQVVKTYFPTATSEPNTPLIYVDIEITGADHAEKSGVKNDGVDYVNIQITLKTEDEVIFPVNDSFRITLRDSDNKEYSVIKIPFVDGVSTFVFNTSSRSSTVHVSEDDLVIPGMSFTFKVRGDNRLFIYEDFTS